MARSARNLKKKDCVPKIKHTSTGGKETSKSGLLFKRQCYSGNRREKTACRSVQVRGKKNNRYGTWTGRHKNQGRSHSRRSQPLSDAVGPFKSMVLRLSWITRNHVTGAQAFLGGVSRCIAASSQSLAKRRPVLPQSGSLPIPHFLLPPSQPAL